MRQDFVDMIQVQIDKAYALGNWQTASNLERRLKRMQTQTKATPAPSPEVAEITDTLRRVGFFS